MKRSIPLQRNALVSFHYFRDYDLNRLPNLRLIGDSGAFSAKTQGVQITVDDLAEWAVKYLRRKHGKITAPEWIQGGPAGPNEFAAAQASGNGAAYHLDALITSPAPAGPIEHAAPTSTPVLGDMNAAAGQGDR